MADDAQYVEVGAINDLLIEILCYWIERNHLHVREAMKSHGGWEVWAQLELLFAWAEWAHSEYPNNIVNLEREKPGIWPHSQEDKVDFWFTWKEVGDNNNQQYMYWGVELKCRSAAAKHPGFLNNVLGDFQKCNQLVVQPENQPKGQIIMYAIAITYDVHDRNGYNPDIWPNTFYTKLEPPGGEVPLEGEVPPEEQDLKPTYVIWRQFRH